MKCLIFLLMLLLFSCGKPGTPPQFHGTSAISANFFDTFIIKKTSTEQAWGTSISKNLYYNMKDPSLASLFDNSINEADLIQLKCANFNTLNDDEKALFYIVFFSAIADLESGFNPEDMTYDNSHKNWNIGLLQIDIDSAQRHAPEISDLIFSNDDLKNSNFNLHVGLYILKNQLNGKYRPEIRGRLMPSGSYYWEVLNKSYRNKFLRAFFNNYDLLTFCEK